MRVKFCFNSNQQLKHNINILTSRKLYSLNLSSLVSSSTTPTSQHNEIKHEKHIIPKENEQTIMDQVSKMREILNHPGDSQNNNDNPPPKKNDSTIKTSKWDDLWQKGITPWDLGKPTPALSHELKKGFLDLKIHQMNQQYSNNNQINIKSLVPGCGAGYDVVTIAQFHDSIISQIITSNHDDDNLETNTSLSCQFKNKSKIQSTVIGLDISPASLLYANRKISEMIQKDSYPSSSSSSSSSSSKKESSRTTHIQLQHGDFFESPSKWSNIELLNNLPNIVNDTTTYINQNQSTSSTSSLQSFVHLDSSSDSEVNETGHTMKFDFIFDYTFFCALPPNLRSQWAKQMSQLLEPNRGRLLTFVFPIPPPISDTTTTITTTTTNDIKMQQQESLQQLEGPPYPVTFECYRKVLEPYGFHVVDGGGPYESIYTVKGRVGKEQICWWELRTVAKL